MITQRSIDIWWSLAIPLICLFSCVTNLFASVVYAMLARDSPTHLVINKYQLVKSCIATLYSFVCSFVFLLKCNTLCTAWSASPTFSYAQRLYELYVYNYVSTSLVVLDLLVEVVIAFERLCVLTNANHLVVSRHRIGTIVACLALFIFVFFSPNLVLWQIRKSQVGLFCVTIGNLPLFKIFVVAMMTLRGFLIIALIVVVNVVSCQCYVRLVRTKQELTRSPNNHRPCKLFIFFYFFYFWVFLRRLFE